MIDAFVRGRMASYLRRLEDGLAGAGFHGSLCDPLRRGRDDLRRGRQRPFETIMSGPVAGAEGSAELARRLELTDVVTADVGGTRFDTCLILDGRLPVLYEGAIVGMPVQTSWVDVRSIGAGGGSLADVDVGGLLRVGPQSAGASRGSRLPPRRHPADGDRRRRAPRDAGRGELAGGVTSTSTQPSPRSSRSRSRSG